MNLKPSLLGPVDVSLPSMSRRLILSPSCGLKSKILSIVLVETPLSDVLDHWKVSMPVPPMSSSRPAPPMIRSLPSSPEIQSFPSTAEDPVVLPPTVDKIGLAVTIDGIGEFVAIAGDRLSAQLQILHIARQGVGGKKRQDTIETFVEVFDDLVAGIIDDIGVAFGAADHDVCARSAIEKIAVSLAIERIVAAFAEQPVVAVAAKHFILARSSVNGIGAVTGEDAIVGNPKTGEAGGGIPGVRVRGERNVRVAHKRNARRGTRGKRLIDVHGFLHPGARRAPRCRKATVVCEGGLLPGRDREDRDPNHLPQVAWTSFSAGVDNGASWDP